LIVAVLLILVVVVVVVVVVVSKWAVVMRDGGVPGVRLMTPIERAGNSNT